jgi:hypothetical protein
MRSRPSTRTELLGVTLTITEYSLRQAALCKGCDDFWARVSSTCKCQLSGPVLEISEQSGLRGSGVRQLDDFTFCSG